MGAKIRLDKYLADMGIGTRTEVKSHIKKGRVTVNDIVVKSPELKLDISKDTVCFEHQPVGYVAQEYYLFYKPEGCVSATEDRTHRTVLDYIDAKRKDLFPVGRLDIDTEGLLLITNDGALAHQLLSPKKHVDKTYFARIAGCVTMDDVRTFAEGVDIGEEKLTMPARLEILSSGAVSEIRVTIHEGKYHQVKRMFEAIGKQVCYLKRLSMGPLTLDPSLTPGEYRSLTEEEIRLLKEQEKKAAGKEQE